MRPHSVLPFSSSVSVFQKATVPSSAAYEGKKTSAPPGQFRSMFTMVIPRLLR